MPTRSAGQLLLPSLKPLLLLTLRNRQAKTVTPDGRLPITVIKEQSMNLLIRLTGAASIAALAIVSAAHADVSEKVLNSLGAPDKIETSAGTLEFKDGVPTAEIGAEGLRHAGLHQRPQRLQQQLPRRLGARPGQGLRRRRRQARRCRHLLRTDGFELAVPDGQRRHGLLPRGARPEQRPDGDRAAVERRRHDQRHVVLLDHRHRRPRP